MPVTIRPSNRVSEPFGQNPFYSYPLAASPEQLLQSTISDDTSSQRTSRQSTASPQAKCLVQSSFDALNRDDNVYATKNGLVHASIEAYNQHHNLILRPDDVWFAIISQLGSFINVHASDLRHVFVSTPESDGPQHIHLEIPLTPGLDHGEVAYKMTKALGARLKDETLRDWILPVFTTTEKGDQAVASVLFLGAMQKYFTYSWGTRCGIPSVTLLGQADDWALIRDRCAARLGEGDLGKAVADWWAVLRPVLDKLVETFHEPESPSTLRFWQEICCEHTPNGSGTTTYSGWIMAFCYFSEQGKPLYKPSRARTARLARSDIPMGFSKVPITLLDNGTPIQTEMLAGSVGIKVRNLEEERQSDGEKTSSSRARNRRQGYDTVQPETGWFLFRV